MPDWQERITHDTNPATRAEHAVRYALAAPLIADSELWVDLGCGAGLAAAEALGEAKAKRALLVDVDQESADEAARNVPAEAATALRADLTNADDLARLTAEAGEHTGTITCFEVVEHLETFIPLVELLIELSQRFTVVLSVPNDAHWALENPYHVTMWGEGSFAELRSLLPDGHVVLHQVVLQGSAAVPLDGGALETSAPVQASADGVPSHFLVALGPRAGELAAGARVAATDLGGARRWERQRESNIAFLEGRVAELEADLKKFIALAAERNVELEQIIGEREDFRRYIHELEGRLAGGQAALPSAGE